VRRNIPDDRQAFASTLDYLDNQVSNAPAGTLLGTSHHLRICAATNEEEDVHQVDSVSRQPTRLALVSTIQFAAALQQLKDQLGKDQDSQLPLANVENIAENNAISQQPRKNIWNKSYVPIVPRSKPLSPGEILGCTAPSVKDVDALMSVCSLSILRHLQVS
jgi:2-(3-amino-3-carboxypropyl)histidine synthase